MYQKHILNNGSLLVTVPLSRSFSATVMAIVEAGPRFDPQGKEGLSHFVEHMLFKGTKKWPSSYKLASSLEIKGSTAEAFSYHENNTYWIKSAAEDMELAIENLSERLNNSLLKEKDIETEKGVVLEELNICKSNPTLYIWELWSETLWKNHPRGRTYIGNEKSISSFTRNDVIKYLKNFYLPQRIIYVVSGKINSQKANTLFNKYLGSRKRNINNTSFASDYKQTHNLKIQQGNFENITVAIGFPTIYFGHNECRVLEIIATLLAEGFSSRLRQKVMEPGYTYSIEAYAEHLSDAGYLMIRFTTNKNNLNKVLKIILEEFKDLRSNFVSEDELALAKGYYSGSLKVNTETSYDWAKWYGGQFIFNKKKVLNLEDKIKLIKQISSHDIIKVAQKYFLSDKLCLAILGNVKEKEINFTEGF